MPMSEEESRALAEMIAEKLIEWFDRRPLHERYKGALADAFGELHRSGSGSAPQSAAVDPGPTLGEEIDREVRYIREYLEAREEARILGALAEASQSLNEEGTPEESQRLLEWEALLSHATAKVGTLHEAAVPSLQRIETLRRVEEALRASDGSGVPQA